MVFCSEPIYESVSCDKVYGKGECSSFVKAGLKKTLKEMRLRLKQKQKKTAELLIVEAKKEKLSSDVEILNESIISVEMSIMKYESSKSSSRTSTPIFNEKNLKSYLRKEKRTKRKLKKKSAEKRFEFLGLDASKLYNYNKGEAKAQPINIHQINKMMILNENNLFYYNSTESTPDEFQDFGDFKVWYV